jgi:hypothetical protein
MELDELSKYDIVDLAWASGLIEGEGCFMFNPERYQYRVVVGSVDLDVLEKLQAIFNCGKVYRKQNTITGKPFWQWMVTKKEDTVNICHLVLPFMGKRRTLKIEELLRSYKEKYGN